MELKQGGKELKRTNGETLFLLLVPLRKQRKSAGQTYRVQPCCKTDVSQHDACLLHSHLRAGTHTDLLP